jgi:hypothetical protein
MINLLSVAVMVVVGLLGGLVDNGRLGGARLQPNGTTSDYKSARHCSV